MSDKRNDKLLVINPFSIKRGDPTEKENDALKTNGITDSNI